MSKFIDKKLKSLIPYTPGEQPKNIKNLIKLNTNESPYPPSPNVLKAVTNQEINDLRLYPDPTNSSLREALAKRFGVDSSQVTLGNGSDELLGFCFHGFCENGAAFADITYGFYKVFANMFSLECDIIPLRDDFSIDVDDYMGVRKTVFIANPNAPTGKALKLAELEELLLQDRQRLVIVDEAYIDFGADSAIPLLKEYENLLVVGTFSKSRQLAGARVGYAVSNEGIIKDLDTMRYSFNPYNVNRLSQTLAKAAIEDEKYFDYCKNMIIENRQYLTKKLKSLDFDVALSLTNFVFAKHSSLGGREYYERLKEYGILVRHFDEERISDYVRITIGTTDELDSLIKATKSILGLCDLDCEY